MFSDLKNIENEINQFKSNMNSVGGLMSVVKDICSKMDHQISQGDLYIERIDKVHDITSERLTKIALLQEKIAKEQMVSLGTAIEKQADRLMEIQQKFEGDIQIIIQTNKNLSLEINEQICHSVAQLNDASSTIVQMNRSWLSEHKAINAKTLISINEQFDKFINEYKKAVIDMNNQITQMAVNQNEIIQYYDNRFNQLQITTASIENKVRLFGLMTIAGIIFLGLLIILL